MKNEYKIVDDYVIIYIKKRMGEILETYIDLEDFEKVKSYNLKWTVRFEQHTNSYYAQSSKYLGIINGKPKYRTTYLHRIILDIDNIPNSRNIIPHHKNHDTLDNRKYNLQIKNTADNSVIRKEINKNNKSGYRNVFWNKRKEKWVVHLQINGKNTQLGSFIDVHEAGKFAEEMRLKYYSNR